MLYSFCHYLLLDTIFISAFPSSNLYQWTLTDLTVTSHSLGYNSASSWNIYLQSPYPAYKVLAHWGQVAYIYINTSQWTVSTLLQVMVCYLVGAKPEPMLDYCQLYPWEKLQWNLNQNTQSFIQEDPFDNVICIFHSWKSILKCRLQNVSHFV